jgi:hypothetical protein
MDTAIVVALVGIGGTLVNVTYTSLVAARGQRLKTEFDERVRERERLEAQRDRERTKAETVESIVKRYRDPLLRASFDLQSRVYNIVRRRFIATYYGDERRDTTEYARENTLFVIAEFLGWVEILRREVRFLDLGVETRNQEWVNHLAAVRNVLQHDRGGPVFQIMNGQQRAIGEVMIEPVAEPDETSPRQETIGYAAFVVRRREHPDFAHWFDPLADDIALLAREPDRHLGRLIALQHALVDLMEFLDPDCVRLPASERTKLPLPGAAPAAGT